MAQSCDICGEPKPVHCYKCEIAGGTYTDYLFLCKECRDLQKKEGPVTLDTDIVGY